jgi:hypothetical protein
MDLTRIDDVNDIIKCPLCSNSYSNPITLPCGDTICFEHLEDHSYTKDRKFMCDICNKFHTLPDEGFPKNKAIEKMLKIRLDKLDRGESYKNAKASFEKFNSKFKSYEEINNDPDNYINDYFSNMINDIDLRREEIKLEIDNYYDSMINDLKQAQIDSLFMSEANKKVSIDELKFFKREVKSFNKDLRMLDTDEHKWQSIETKSKILLNKIEFKLKEIKDFFLLSKQYEFKQPEFKLDAAHLGSLEMRPTENLLNFNKEITKLKQDFQCKLDDGSSRKYKITTYEDIKTWNECPEQIQHQHKIDDQVIKNILTNIGLF